MDRQRSSAFTFLLEPKIGDGQRRSHHCCAIKILRKIEWVEVRPDEMAKGLCCLKARAGDPDIATQVQAIGIAA